VRTRAAVVTGYGGAMDAKTATSNRTSVVVITRDRCPEVVDTLPRLLALPERAPVILVDNDSSDGTADAVEARYPTVDVLRLESNLGAAARTVGVRRARTPYVMFSDDDSWWAAGALDRAADVLGPCAPAGGAGGPCPRRAGRPTRPRLPVHAEQPPRRGAGRGARALGFVAGGAVVRRSAYLQVGGFHPRYGVGGEEALLALDLAERGWDCAYVDGVVAHHHPSPVRDRRARRVREVRNDMWTLWLRGPLTRVVPGTAKVLARLPVDREARGGMWQALTGAPEC
jgi:GT2 family glycosyltransferase